MSEQRIRRQLATLLLTHRYTLRMSCSCGTTPMTQAEHASHVVDMLIGTLYTDEQYVPVTTSGDRWTPRTRIAAIGDLNKYRVGGLYENSDCDALECVKHEIRYATDWFTIGVIT